jgi:hypothetical protein
MSIHSLESAILTKIQYPTLIIAVVQPRQLIAVIILFPPSVQKAQLALVQLVQEAGLKVNGICL